jgi:hypothetical protein
VGGRNLFDDLYIPLMAFPSPDARWSPGTGVSADELIRLGAIPRLPIASAIQRNTDEAA